MLTILPILILNSLENLFRQVLKMENKINFDRLLLNQFLERIVKGLNIFMTMTHEQKYLWKIFRTYTVIFIASFEIAHLFGVSTS